MTTEGFEVPCSYELLENLVLLKDWSNKETENFKIVLQVWSFSSTLGMHAQ